MNAEDNGMSKYFEVNPFGSKFFLCLNFFSDITKPLGHYFGVLGHYFSVSVITFAFSVIGFAKVLTQCDICLSVSVIPLS